MYVRIWCVVCFRAPFGFQRLASMHTSWHSWLVKACTSHLMLSCVTSCSICSWAKKKMLRKKTVD